MLSPSLAALLLAGCANFPRSGNTEPVVLDTDTDTISPTAQVTWASEGITLMLTGSSGMNFVKFGIAQNDLDCLLEEDDEEIPGCWTGEDCLDGDLAADGATSLSVCHAIGTRTNLVLEFVEGGISSALEDGKVPAISGQYTAFPDDSYEYLVTYYLEEEDGACWRWGLDTSYYAGLGCNNAN
ncbi:MAG: hypothetical protein ACI8S6_004232 [Myxococcota bacterium]|jgi:hypothetical protein